MLFALIGCSQVNKTKNNHGPDTKNTLIEFEDIYSNQQQSEEELGLVDFYKVKINNVDSTISLYPKKELVSVKDIETIRNRKSLSASDIGVGTHSFYLKMTRFLYIVGTVQ